MRDRNGERAGALSTLRASFLRSPQWLRHASQARRATSPLFKPPPAASESVAATRPKTAAEGRRGGSGGIYPKNFFVAKNQDSESATGCFWFALLFVQSSLRDHVHQTSIKESTAAQALFAFSKNLDVDLSCSSHIGLR
jgi:hypothetical protein